MQTPPSLHIIIYNQLVLYLSLKHNINNEKDISIITSSVFTKGVTPCEGQWVGSGQRGAPKWRICTFVDNEFYFVTGFLKLLMFSSFHCTKILHKKY